MALNIQVCFETVTPESCEDGDFADHGWITQNEYRVSIGGKCRSEDAYSKRVRMSQRGRYDWTKLGEAVAFILDKAENAQAEVDTDYRIETHRGHYTSWTVRVTVERRCEDECSAESVGYDLFVSGLSHGSAMRLERFLTSKGIRLPYARSCSLRTR